MASEYDNKLYDKWQKMVEDIPSDSAKINTARILENQERYFDGTLNEVGGVASTSTGGGAIGGNSNLQGFARYKKIIIPLVRRVFPELITNQLIGTQPMVGPVGLAYALRFRYMNSVGSITAGDELGYNNIDQTYSANTSADRPFDTKEGERLDSNNFLGGPSGNRKEIGLTIERKQIIAHGRYLKAEWSLEAQQDLQAMQQVDIESEVTDALAYQLSADIDREVVDAINTLAKQGGVFTWNYNTSADGRWEKEKIQTLYSLILKASEDVAIATRRGPANWILCSPNVVGALEGLDQFTYRTDSAATPSNEIYGQAYVGMLGRFKVYRDTFATSDYVTVGYKGVKDNDSGIIFNPYVPIMFAKTQGEEDFHPRLGVMTRYAICDNLFGAENYYRYLAVNLGNKTFGASSTTSGSYTATTPYTVNS